MALICYLLGNRHFPVPYPVATMGAYVLLAIILAGAALYLTFENVYLDHLVNLGLCLVFLLVILLVERPRFRSKI